jgi:hypothetical protein
MSHFYLESHGVQLDIEVQDEGIHSAVEAILPPGWLASDKFPEDGHLTIATGSGGLYDVLVDAVPVALDMTAEVAVHAIDAEICAKVALLSRSGIFVHAGVVEVAQRALVIPGPSFSGKSSLVAALVAAGATYFSDEFAVIDSDGLVRPYARPLSLRRHDARYGEKITVESMGGRAGTQPTPVGLIAVTSYVPDGHWEPQRRSSGAGAIALLSNAVAARSRPEETMRAVNRAASQAVVLEGARGDAVNAAASLMRAFAGLREA